MSRPKGSKNKKTLVSEARLDDDIAVRQAEKQKLAEEEQGILAAIDELKEQLKAKRKEIRAAEKAIASLEEKKAKADAIAAAAAKKQEIEAVVSSLVSSGKTADEILAMLGK